MCITSRKLVPAILLLSLLLVIKCQNIDELIEKCLYENGISKDEYEVLVNRTSSEEDLESLDERYKCAVQCMVTQMELVDSNGYWDVELFAKYQDLSDDQREYFYECKQVHDALEDMCEYAFQMTTCLKEKIGPMDYSSSSESEEDEE